MLNKRNLLNLSLLLALAILGLLVIYEPGRAPAPEATAITTLGITDIRHIRLQRPGQADLELKRDDDQWIITGTPTYPAADSPVRSLLQLAEAPVLRHYAVQDLDLDKIGLTDSASRVTFNQDTVILFGGTDPLDDNRYVQVGDRISLIQNRFQHLLEGGIEQWISRRLLPKDSAIEAIELPNLRLHKTGDSGWQLEPEQPDIDTDAMVALVERWQQIRAIGVRLHEGATQGPEVHIQLQGQADPIRFYIQEAGEDRLFIRTDLGLAYRLSAYQATELLHFTASATPAAP